MAKASPAKSGTSRIRFIMLEADLNEGDLSQVTQAIQNALRPSQSITRLLQSPSSPRTTSKSQEEVIEDGVTEELEEEGEQVETPKARTPRAGKPRVAKTPTVLDDIDVSSDPSLKDFVADYDLSTNVDKYLVVALWFRDARGISSVTVDHVYTCFKLLGWSTSTNDFSKPLKNLRDEQSFKGGAKDGYSLTLTGAGKIEAKKRAA